MDTGAPDIFDKVRLPQGLDGYLRATNPWWEGKPGRVLPAFRRWAFDVLLKKLNAGSSAVAAAHAMNRQS